MVERITVHLPTDLFRRAKRKAAAEGRSLRALIEDGLRRVVNEDGPPGEAKRILPPVSMATGGMLPGIDLSETASWQDLEDLDHIGGPE